MINHNYTMSDTWFDKIPKVELHVHLEGAIPHNTLWELVQKYGGEPSVPNLQSLKDKFQYRDFSHFIKTWEWKNQFLREYEDFTFFAKAVAKEFVDQNILYAEAIFAPSEFARYGLKTQKLAEAIRTGLSKIPRVEVALIADLVRSREIENTAKTLAELDEVRNLGIVGITIGGSEQDYPPEPFAEIYERARYLGFHTSAHAGEAAGPDSIWGAINSLQVERIGHGTRAIEDEVLVNFIAEQRLPIEICLISNVKTGVVKSIEKHPVRHYFNKGIPISINIDDPKLFGNSLSEEYCVMESRLGFSRDEIRKIIIQSIQSSWLPEDRKLNLTRMFRHDPNW